MVAATKRSLSEFLEGDELFVEAERDDMITGNHAGVKLALQNTEIPVIHSKLDQLRKDLEKLEARMAGTEQKLAGTEQRLAGTKQKLSEFQQELAGTDQELSESQHASGQFGQQARAQFSIGFADTFVFLYGVDPILAKKIDALDPAGYAGDYLDPMQADAQLNELHKAYKDFWVASRLISSEELQRVSLFLQPEIFLYLNSTTKNGNEYLSLLKRAYHITVTQTKQEYTENPRFFSLAPVQRLQEFQN
ncbi:hypothetical protein BO83DRAFT_415991 [Aspergillus eucalypticola CBS 122712]|uniref:Uncharacterized protein n=1 Tax=Aspergillus eucalypticola (strain CBS 122712 / IBT 29274) TaxID=1448314 RepID=A0A317VRT1_ASPEC|nr:uncharacterized protein BO83DRAFT_415991 [Aspergillus eucalypticola CBS 122712]PWY76655.1 hypothetical protein BO83DRAFT_415991 [Aspergillus eucalypticola CBS 122712]